ncbi:hypothetical protein COCC4DRAFT_63102 [Bipolaris maydis ATCC 48331]|uniref:Uncharacterized protein n=2 Tax=Cochliobolus heterostrophus TaxID=5016 RepID=M2VDV3_COCH5|nr:uncharacterized protein COCC4DRAFT_63102 [Bipolaris maydis ATCC 48331]EMD97853.1 hypothetical protein COCHEDRAFT_1026193 [Bipolaris maydis C5]ENI02750.1 hypothetical protein COCC4DRAFT_63102 [Bipolaris maydis ATCC 48331]
MFVPFNGSLLIGPAALSRHRLRYFHANPTDSPAARSLRYSQKGSSTSPSPTPSPRELQCPKAECGSKSPFASGLSPSPAGTPRAPLTTTSTATICPDAGKKSRIAISAPQSSLHDVGPGGVAGVPSICQAPMPPGPKDKAKNGFPSLRQAIE